MREVFVGEERLRKDDGRDREPYGEIKLRVDGLVGIDDAHDGIPPVRGGEGHKVRPREANGLGKGVERERETLDASDGEGGIGSTEALAGRVDSDYERHWLG